MWIVVCCIFQFKDSNGNDNYGIFYMFFVLGNYFGVDNLGNCLEIFFKKYKNCDIVLFLSNSDCREDVKYIKFYQVMEKFKQENEINYLFSN